MRLRPAVLSLLAVLALAGCTGAPLRPSGAAVPPFAVKVVGQGRPMILIPGLASGGAVYDGLVAHYQAGHECHVLTLAGFAGQPAIDGPLLAATRAALAEYIRAHKLERPTVVGHSLGGVLALKLAAEEPALVGEVVVLDSLPFLAAAGEPEMTEVEARQQAEQLRQMMRMQPVAQFRAQQRRAVKAMVTGPANAEKVLEWGMRSDVEAVANAMAEMYGMDLRPELPKVAAPVLVLASGIPQGPGLDRAGLEQVFAQQYASLKGVKRVTLANARHFVMMDDEAGVLREMDAFLKDR